MEATVKIRDNGSVEEAFHMSSTYYISAENAKIVGSAAGLIAKGVSRVNGGFEFFMDCTEQEASRIVKNHNGVDLKFVS